MRNKVIFLHYGPQCYWRQYMGKQAELAANLLDMDYVVIDVDKNSEKAEEFCVYFPGAIVIDGFQIGYPGKPEELVESYRRRGPLDGSHSYQQLPKASPDKIELLQDNIGHGCAICGASAGFIEKTKWMKQKAEQLGMPVGLIAFNNQEPVATVEWVGESDIPYPIPKKRTNALFITCIYNSPGAKYDYRQALLERMGKMAKDAGYEAISIISGTDTPHPNGPHKFLESCGFQEKTKLGKVLMRYKREEMFFMEWKI